jgi:hypothetical protein
MDPKNILDLNAVTENSIPAVALSKKKWTDKTSPLAISSNPRMLRTKKGQEDAGYSLDSAS